MPAKNRQQPSREEWEHLLASSENDLYATLALEHGSAEGRIYWGFPSPKEGREYFKQLEPKLHILLCRKWQACKRIGQYKDEVELAMAIAGAIAGGVVGASAVTISTLIVKIGVKRYCGCPD